MAGVDILPFWVLVVVATFAKFHFTSRVLLSINYRDDVDRVKRSNVAFELAPSVTVHCWNCCCSGCRSEWTFHFWIIVRVVKTRVSRSLSLLGIMSVQFVARWLDFAISVISALAVQLAVSIDKKKGQYVKLNTSFNRKKFCNILLTCTNVLNYMYILATLFMHVHIISCFWKKNMSVYISP